MKIINLTDIPTERLNALIRFCAPKRIRKKFILKLRFFKGVNISTGTALLPGYEGYRGKIPYLTISITDRPLVFPIYDQRKYPYFSKFYKSREEVLVGILAHELRHLWQLDHKGNGRGRISEKDCEIYAMTKIDEWRTIPLIINNPKK